MAVGIKEKKDYYNIKEGKIVHSITKQKYDFIEGLVKDIRLKSSMTDKGVMLESVQIQLEDMEGVYILDIIFDGNVARSILNNLASTDELMEIKINTYVMKGKDGNYYTRASVYNNLEKLSWRYNAEELPTTKEITVNGQTVKDRTELIKKYREIVAEIQKHLENTKEQREVYSRKMKESRNRLAPASAPEIPVFDDDIIDISEDVKIDSEAFGEYDPVISSINLG